MSDDIFADDFRRLASENLRAARILGDQSLWQQSFHSAGFAVECALKFRIMTREGLNRWPDRAQRPELYSHNLASLAIKAGLEPLLLAALQAGDERGRNWLVAKDWGSDIRYDPRPFPAARGQAMLLAVDQGGLIEWLLK